jgi:hypothetical protein
MKKNLYAGNFVYKGGLGSLKKLLSENGIKGSLVKKEDHRYSMTIYYKDSKLFQCKLHWSPNRGTIWFTGDRDVISENTEILSRISDIKST